MSCLVAVIDKYGHKVAISRQCVGVIDVPSLHLWWPYLSGPPNEEPGYLYTLEVHLMNDAMPKEEDVYRLQFGIRTIQVTNSSFSINGRPFYFRGFGRHEDYSVRHLSYCIVYSIVLETVFNRFEAVELIPHFL